MKSLLKLLWWPIARRKVDDQIVADFAGILESELVRRGLRGIVSQPLLDRLTEEAYARAGALESDRIPRYGPMSDEVESVAEKVAELLSGEKAVDRAIDTILVHHGAKRSASITK